MSKRSKLRSSADQSQLSPDRYKKLESLAEKFGIVPPKKDGILTEAGQAAMDAGTNVIRGIGSTAEELGITWGDDLREGMDDIRARNQQWLPDPEYKATSFDPAHLSRTISSGVTQSGTALAAGLATTIATGGNAFAGGAVTTGLIFTQTYGDEVKDFRKAMPGQSEGAIQGLAFFSALGQGLIESVAGPEAIASGLAKKIIKGALKKTIKQYGWQRVKQIAFTVGKNAAKGGLGEGAEEVFQGLVSNVAKIAGGADIPLMTLNDAIEQFAGGALPGAFMSSFAGGVEANQHIEAEPKEDAPDLLGEAVEDKKNTDIPGNNTEIPEQETIQPKSKKKYNDGQVKSFKQHWKKSDNLPSEDLTENLQRLTKNSSLDQKAVVILNPKSRLTKALAEVSKELTGQEPVYFLPKTPEAGLANGFIGKNNQLFINVETMANNPGVTTGHEFGHFLKNTDKATYKGFQKILADNLKDNHSEYLESILKVYDEKGIDLSQEQGMDELTNDVIGDFFVDDKFWKEVFSSKQDPGKLQKLAQAIIRFVDTIAGKLKGVNGTNKYLSDLDKIRSEAAKIVSEKLEVKTSTENTEKLKEKQKESVKKEKLKPLFEMDIEELEKTSNESSVSEQQLAIDVFGEERAAEYEKAYRKSHSMNNKRADEGQAIVDKMESELSKEQQNHLFGIGNNSLYDVEESKEYLRKLQDLDFENAESLGKSLMYAATQIGSESDPTKMNYSEKIAYAQFRYAYKKANELGFDLDKIIDSTLKNSFSRFSDPNDAVDMLSRFIPKKNKSKLQVEQKKQVPEKVAQKPEITPQKEVEQSAGKTEKVVQKEKTPENKIEDFGEKISGARKEVWAEKLAKFNADEIKSKKDLTINKIFPLPDYEKLKTEGVSQKALSFIHVIRAAIKKELGRSRLSSLESMKQRIAPLVELAQEMGDIGYEKALDLLNKQKYERLKHEVNRISDLGFPDVPADVAKYDIFTDELSKRIAIVRGSYIISPDFTSKADAQEWLKNYFARKKEAAKKVSVKLEIFSNRSTGDIFIAKKNGSRKYIYLKQGFKSTKEAREYLNTHRAELEEQYKELVKIPEERRASNRDRIGEDHTGGKDVVPEMFSESFGFRGVQFGNWVENKKRQQDLNEAYNALVDLANILNIPTKAISLNGELGLAFGARGHGRAMAHYESDHTVINLTKKKGAGSLAHEWFHALDNYFGKQLGFERMLTDRTKPKHNRKGELDYGGMRPEVLEKAQAVMKAIESSDMMARAKKLDEMRTKDYWSTLVEMSARSFESYIIDRLDLQDSQNDYLANISSPEEYGRKEMYPYPLLEDKEKINKAFDELFETIKTKETDKGTVMYSLKRDAEGFEKQVDNVSSGKLPKSGMINVLARTPKVIQEAGAQDLPIEIRANKVKQILDKHSLPLDIIKHIPEQLDNPLMIFESDRQKDSLVILTKLEHNGGSVMAALQLNKKQAHYEINRLNSVYAKHKDVFVRYLKAGLLRYADKKEAPEWLHSVGLAEELLHQVPRDKSYQRLSKDKDTSQDDKSQADYSLNMVRAKQKNPGLSPEVQALNETVQDGYEPGVRSHAELDEKADETIEQFGEEELLKNLADGHLVMNTDENMRLGLKLINSKKMIDMIRTGDIAAADAMMQWVKQGTEAGRLLNSRKIKTDSPDDIMGILKGLLFAPSKKYRHEKDPAKKQEILKTHERKLINKALNNLKSKDIDFFNLTQEQLADIKLVSNIAREIQIAKSNFGDKAYEWWINGLLSLPKTHAANIVGNTAMAVTELAPQRFVEASFNLIVNNKKGATFGEFKHMWKALRDNAGHGFKDAWNAFQTGMPVHDAVQKLESANAAIPGKFGEVVRLPGRFLLAADEFAKSILIPIEASAYAYRTAKAEGLKGEAMKTRMKKLTENSKSEAVEWAISRSEELTFQAKPWAFVEHLVAAKNTPGFTGRFLSFMFPFVRTPSNILTTTFRKSPFGSVALFTRLATGRIKLNDEKFIRHTAEQLVAWGSLMAIWSMMGDDDDELPFITGSKGRYGTAQYKWKQRNLPNTSIRLGDRWYDYSRIEPFGSALAMMIDGLNSLTMINKGADGSRVMGKLLESVVATNLRDKSFLQSVGDVLKATEETKHTAITATNFVSSWVPNVVRGTLNALEDNIPDRRGYSRGMNWFKEQFTSGVLERAGMGATPRIDLWGNEIHKDDIKGDVNPFLWRIASPMRTRESGMHKPDELLFNWNSQNVNEEYWPMVPAPRYSKLHKSLYMNSDLYHKYAKRAGELAFGKVDQLISVGRLNHKKPSTSDIKLLKKIFRKARQQAKRELLK